MNLLNIACGARYHKDWTNIDFHADSNLVRKVNILDGLPFKEGCFDAVYSSHFLEHLSLAQSKFVLREAQRVLKRRGVLRIVVPDLENVCKEYLKILDGVSDDVTLNTKYRWIIVELLDQFVRVDKGGEMGRIFSQVRESGDTHLADYISHRVGDQLIASDFEQSKSKRKITIDKVKNRVLYFYLRLVAKLVPKAIRGLVFSGSSIGEKHQWAYDRYSLPLLLGELGFNNIKIKSFKDSDIENFNDFFLDVRRDGTQYKGVSSIYIEARK